MFTQKDAQRTMTVFYAIDSLLSSIRDLDRPDEIDFDTWLMQIQNEVLNARNYVDKNTEVSE